MVDWPTDLPGKLSGIGDQLKSGAIRSEMDAGPALKRRRFTAAVRNVDIPVRFTNAQREIFDEWYATDLQFGVLSFNWTDPVTGDEIAYRFRETDGPSFTGEGGGDFKYWTGVLPLEILP